MTLYQLSIESLTHKHPRASNMASQFWKLSLFNYYNLLNGTVKGHIPFHVPMGMSLVPIDTVT